MFVQSKLFENLQQLEQNVFDSISNFTFIFDYNVLFIDEMICNLMVNNSIIFVVDGSTLFAYAYEPMVQSNIYYLSLSKISLKITTKQRMSVRWIRSCNKSHGINYNMIQNASAYAGETHGWRKQNVELYFFPFFVLVFCLTR